MRELAPKLRPIRGRADDFAPVLARIGDASIAMMGEATHGTHEFYEARAEITRRLIEQKSLGAVIVEADWPDAYRVNRYVRGESDDASADEALGGFERFPSWMWRNREVERFVEWLRAHNARRSPRERVGLYGMDLYSMYRSIAHVIRFLEEIDPEAAERASARYSCFGHYGGDAQLYGQAAGLGLTPSCEQAAVSQLLDMLQKAQIHAQSRGIDEQFAAEQNARVVKNAEDYYRSMFHGRVDTWNLRDHHMAETIDHVRDYLSLHGRSAKVCVWAHNSHIGDARATDSGARGQLDVGQLMRERHGNEVVLIGFTTHRGTVTAASRWDGPAEKKRVRPALAQSWEQVFHDLREPRFSLETNDEAFAEWRLHRAIGVVYLPRSERVSHYYHAELARAYDVVVHYDETHALEPIELWPVVEAEPGETFPFGV